MFGIRSIAAFALLFLASGAVASTLPRNPPVCNEDTPSSSPRRYSRALMDTDAVTMARMPNASLRLSGYIYVSSGS
ncbi:hypothetical protein BDN72DRAFT_901295 [Pluteus cervinus]|uniref:Uncharacterized protein n=1 Tax=Pluteus cervinus TaxID=181527 RepID=A0ACD3AHC4_9AGAR|nr:hypothetical protein BDN72DRAFT_901295 [Pluteus cervinus]